ncbi:MAG: hypothetical protein AAF352_07830, partial [Pseudomonadota bacterium]
MTNNATIHIVLAQNLEARMRAGDVETCAIISENVFAALLQGNTAAMEAILAHALQIYPQDDHILQSLALNLTKKSLPEQALQVLERCSKGYRNSREWASTLAVVLLEGKKFTKAITVLEGLRKSYGERLNIVFNLCVTQRAIGLLDEALSLAAHSMTLFPKQVNLQHLHAVLLLHMGDYRRGFPAYEARFDMDKFCQVFSGFGAPFWRGEDLRGKSLLIIHEQGLGDTIQFMRFLPKLVAHDACQAAQELTFWVPPALQHMVDHLYGDLTIQISSKDLLRKQYDYILPMLSVPTRLGLGMEHIDGAAYITIPPDVASPIVWDSDSVAKTLKVGICNHGKINTEIPNHFRANIVRNINVSEILPILQCPDIVFVDLNFQHPILPEHLPAGVRMRHINGVCENYAHTAAVLDQLDLVITVDTSIAHMAAGLGVPTWMIARYDGCWRWMEELTDSPWYDAITIFRQVK